MEHNRWDRAEELLVSCAEDDLARTGEVEPALVAFKGEELQFVAWLRPFEKGEYHDPMIELLALAMPLDVDRLALSIAGRAWSLHDPPPPAGAGGDDLRQRVHMVHLCDGYRRTPQVVSLVRSFDIEGGTVRWGETQRLEGGAEGWVPVCLEVAVNGRRDLRAPLSQIARQARRVDALGHELYVSPELAARLLLDVERAG